MNRDNNRARCKLTGSRMNKRITTKDSFKDTRGTVTNYRESLNLSFILCLAWRQEHVYKCSPRCVVKGGASGAGPLDLQARISAPVGLNAVPVPGRTELLHEILPLHPLQAARQGCRQQLPNSHLTFTLCKHEARILPFGTTN